MNKNINQLVGEITSLAVVITSNTKADVFIEYSAHCDLLDIKIHSKGWNENKNPDINEHVYTKPDKFRTEKELVKKLEKIEKQLIRIAHEGRINFLKLPYETVEVKEYRLSGGR